MELKTVGILGYGAFGALAHTLLKRFGPGVMVKVFAPEKNADGETFYPLAEVARCDAVILAVPIHAFEEVLTKVLPLTRKDTVLVDVATVKVHTTNLLKKFARGRRYISTHPVWGPESYEKRAGDVSGFRIVVTDHTLPIDVYAVLIKQLEKCGFDVVEMSAKAHDKHLAETLFLTHLVGQTVVHAGFRRTDMDTVSFGFLMHAVESVLHDEKLFKDVYRFNPYCKEVLNCFEKAERTIRGILEAPVTTSSSVALRIGISGAKGSFSEEAARAYAKKVKLKRFSLDYLVSVENVLATLDSGGIDLGIFPIENSTGGVVTEAIEAMANHNFKIRKLFDIDIKQNLLVREGATAKAVKVIASHEQALKQCRSYLKREWKKVKLKKYEDTAKAAEDLASGKLPASTAVVASKAAADIYGLKILAAGIQDLKVNFTTFIAAVR